MLKVGYHYYYSKCSSVNRQITSKIALINIIFKYVHKRKGPFTYQFTKGGGSLLIFATKCDKGIYVFFYKKIIILPEPQFS